MLKKSEHSDSLQPKSIQPKSIQPNQLQSSLLHTNSLQHYFIQMHRILRPLIIFSAICLALFFTSRVLLTLWQFDRVRETDGFLYTFIQGFRFDFIIISAIISIPTCISLLLHRIRPLAKTWSVILNAYLLIMLVAILLTECATPSFIDQYDIRPNVWFVEYAIYPREITALLFTAYKMELLITGILIALTLGFFASQTFKGTSKPAGRLGWISTLITVPVMVVLFACVIRSTTDHRPVNPSTVAFSNDPMVNTLPLTSIYSVLYAINQLKDEQVNKRPYGDLATEDVFNEVKKAMSINADDFVNSSIPTLHISTARTHRDTPKNIVIILEESLGAEFVGSLGGLPLTPEIDALSKQGIWFENLYATGTRSVRGIEAVISGFLPTTARSVVKLGKSQRHFFTIAKLLKDQGYDTSFIYGGESQFDNMRSFFAGNGFDSVIDNKDYKDPVFEGSWGVSDEDLFNMAHDTFTQLAPKGPFFSLVFSSSNHAPFDYPENRIELFDEDPATVNNAVKYADYAVGQFFKDAKKSNYWDNTIFLVISDHNSRVFGANLVPIQRFHVPALILGSGIKPNSVKRLASQVDMIPTLLSLAGISGTHPAIGIDLTRPDINSIPGRAIMQYGNNYAYMEEPVYTKGDAPLNEEPPIDGNRVIILQPNKAATQYTYANNNLIACDTVQDDFFRKSIAHSIWPTIVYQNQLYRLDSEPLLSYVSTGK